MCRAVDKGYWVLLEAIPCEECGGFGVINCCEGMRAQPEGDNDRSSSVSQGRAGLRG